MLYINCGVTRIVCERKYHRSGESEDMLREAGVQLEYKYDEIQSYESEA